MRIALVCMPMIELKYPSLALTQLSAVIEKRFGSRVNCDTFYLHHDIGHYLGQRLYEFILNELNSGLGEWLFRPLVFPDAPDNAEAYSRQYYPPENETMKRLWQIIMDKRGRLDELFEELLARYHLDEYDLVGFSSLFYQNMASLGMARMIKEKTTDLITVIGGANVEFPMGRPFIKHIPFMDYLFSGPSLFSFPDFISHLLNGHEDAAQTINGLFTAQKIAQVNAEETIQKRTAYGRRMDINQIPALTYDTFLRSYERHFPKAGGKPFLFFNTSEGCFRGEKVPCTFCAQAGPCGNTMSFSPNPEFSSFKINSYSR